jgi:hypothetical protein
MPGKWFAGVATADVADHNTSRAYCEGRRFAKNSGTLVYATGTTGVVASNTGLAWTAKTLGNGLAINLFTPDAANSALAVSVRGNQINISLGTNSSKVAISTAAQVDTAVAQLAAADALVACANDGASTGAGVAAPQFIRLTGATPAVQAGSEEAAAFAAGVTSWTATPKKWDNCDLQYGGGSA